jgi:ribosomal protein S18 acetylase RimI-like enzyme
MAGAHEAPQVARLLIAFRDWNESAGPDEQTIYDAVAQLLEDAATEFLLGSLEETQEPCGVCQIRFRHSVWTGAPDCWLEDLYVEEHARGQGIGRALTELAFHRARLRGARRIELDTNEDNAGAIALYESLGFSSMSKVHAPLTGRDLFMGRKLE